jgi:predicted deacylase
MLNPKVEIAVKENETIYIEKSNWVRANFSGMFHGLITIGSFVKKGAVLAMISDPFGKIEHKLKAPNDGYIINVNDASIVYQGDAVFHISTKLENQS